MAIGRSADYQSAKQQITNLRYGGSVRLRPMRERLNKIRLRSAIFGLCCDYGLADVGFVGNRCGHAWVTAVGQISSPSIQFSAGHSLRLFCCPILGSPKHDRFSRAQGAAA